MLVLSWRGSFILLIAMVLQLISLKDCSGYKADKVSLKEFLRQHIHIYL
jgi:hypothetical protein